MKDSCPECGGDVPERKYPGGNPRKYCSSLCAGRANAKRYRARTTVAHRSQRKQAWYRQNRAHAIESSTTYNQEHSDRRNQHYRDRYATRYRKTRIMKQYGLTEDQFTALDAIKQCQSCGRKKPLTYDHDHQTGRVRGRICHSCNLGIGMLGDTEQTVARVLNYLRRAA